MRLRVFLLLLCLSVTAAFASASAQPRDGFRTIRFCGTVGSRSSISRRRHTQASSVVYGRGRTDLPANAESPTLPPSTISTSSSAT
jgi:hypothetical protein